MDFEELLDLFIVRKQLKENHQIDSLVKNKFSSKSTNNTCQLYQYIPLMLKDVQSLNYKSFEENSNIINFNGKINFRYCLLYGRIVARGKNTKNIHSYVLDDGTATIEIKIFHKENDLQNVWKLETELYSLEKHASLQNKTEVLTSLKNLLGKSREQLSSFKPPLGCKVLIYGKPSIHKNNVSIAVNSLIQNSDCARDIEITFKDKLIDWYNKNVFT